MPACEATLTDANHVLVALSPVPPDLDFFGAVATPGALPDLAGKTVYVAGDLATLAPGALRGAARVFVIDELAHGDAGALPRVGAGRVPRRVGGGLGVYYRQFFAGADYFQRISAEHHFQALTESAKPSKAHRTGIYLTPVREERGELHFRLLRCSTNLAGPTENFCATDHQIVDALNAEASLIFRDHAPLNHVLAQIYANTPAAEGRKQTKAKISAHADKTKDMPVDGVMAFCTFYDGLDKLDANHGYKGKSGLTRLQFRRKVAGPVPEFTVTLHPNSVFFMPLSTNRLYTHEIQSSMLNAELLPTRLGYVVRCSKTEAVHAHGTTFLKLAGERVALEPPTEDGAADLRRLYADENKTEAVIDYGERFRFSMNQGDYRAPDPKRG